MLLHLSFYCARPDVAPEGLLKCLIFAWKYSCQISILPLSNNTWFSFVIILSSLELYSKMQYTVIYWQSKVCYMAERKRRGSKNPVFKSFVKFIILPLILIDTYAYWKVHQTSQSLLSGLLSLSEPLSQVAIVLTINIAVIIILLLYIARAK